MPPQDISGKDGALPWTAGPWRVGADLIRVHPDWRDGHGNVASECLHRNGYAKTIAAIGKEDGDWRDIRQQVADARLIAAAPALYEALLGILETPLTTCDPRNPADWPKLVEFWQYELEQGRGQAPFELAAYAALSLAHGEQP